MMRPRKRRPDALTLYRERAVTHLSGEQLDRFLANLQAQADASHEHVEDLAAYRTRTPQDPSTD